MRLIPYDKSNLKHTGYVKTKNYQILQEFIDSGLDCAKVEGWTHKSASSAQWGLTASIKRFKLNGIKCILVDGEIFLIKKELEN